MRRDLDIRALDLLGRLLRGANRAYRYLKGYR